MNEKLNKIRILLDDIQYGIDSLKDHGADSDIIECLSRIGDIAGSTILNADALSSGEIDSVLSILIIAANLVSGARNINVEETIAKLNDLVSQIEIIYKKKGILLDASSKSVSL